VKLWRRLYGRYARVVVHSESGARRLHDEVGVPVDRVRVIPHPVFRAGSLRGRRCDARLFGLIQG
jgi:hypothetical protein